MYAIISARMGTLTLPLPSFLTFREFLPAPFVGIPFASFQRVGAGLLSPLAGGRTVRGGRGGRTGTFSQECLGGGGGDI